MKFLILAGGGGSRLWPLSRQSWPKQFLGLHPEEEDSLLIGTVRRALSGNASLDDIFIITGADLYPQTLVHLQNAGMGELAKNVICEPMRKNTAPAIAMAASYIREVCPDVADEVIAILPADHRVPDSLQFNTHLEEAEALAKQGLIVTLGVSPTYPETGYGYIEVDADYRHQSWMQVKRFVEKPAKEKAEEYVASGRFLWNAGIFVLSTKSLQAALAAFAPDIHRITEAGYAQAALKFSAMPGISFDYAIMEKVDNAAVIPMRLAWSDLGCWDSVADALKPDESGNAQVGNHIIQIGSTDNLVWNQSERVIATVGISGAIIVDTPDALLIACKEQSQQVKELVDRLGQAEVLARPVRQVFDWGSVYLLNWNKASDMIPVYQMNINAETFINLKNNKNRVSITLTSGKLFSDLGTPFPLFSPLFSFEERVSEMRVTTRNEEVILLVLGEIPDVDNITESHGQQIAVPVPM